MIVEPGAIWRGIVLDSTAIPRTDLDAFARALATARPVRRRLWLVRIVAANLATDRAKACVVVRPRSAGAEETRLLAFHVPPGGAFQWSAPPGCEIAWWRGLRFDHGGALQVAAIIRDNDWNYWMLSDDDVAPLDATAPAILAFSDLYDRNDGAIVLPSSAQIIELVERRAIALTGGIPRA